jgi:uncharacterized repeat protein (TIGR03803 family)
LQGADGDFFGTAGLSKVPPSDFQIGSVYRVTEAGTVTVLHRFNGGNGLAPAGPVAAAADGTLYGTTIAGGAGGRGVVFRLTP